MDITQYIVETLEGMPRHWYVCVEHGQLMQTAAPDVVEGELVVCPCGVLHTWRRVPSQYDRLGEDAGAD